MVREEREKYFNTPVTFTTACASYVKQAISSSPYIVSFLGKETKINKRPRLVPGDFWFLGLTFQTVQTLPYPAIRGG